MGWGYNHPMKAFPSLLLAALILSIPLAACTPADSPPPTPPISAAPAPTEWLYEDLLVLDPIDAPTPDDPDLFAVYFQSTQDNWAHFRLDMFGDDFSDYQIVLDIADSSGASSANEPPGRLLIITNNNGIWHAAATHSNDSSADNFPIFIDEIPETHSVIVSFPEKYLMKKQPMLILITKSSIELVDSAAVFWDNPTPPKAPLLLAFWDTLPANTPAQLLQRWDGAHTGPYGSRHGLKHLLAAVEEYGVPVTLLDLKNPDTLSGLDMIGQVDHIQQLEEQGLLILPEGNSSIFTLVIQQTVLSRKTANGFGFSPSEIAFGSFSDSRNPDYNAFFANLEDESHIFLSNEKLILPLPYSYWEDNSIQQVNEISRDGLTRETWQKLINTALSADDSDILVLGGSLITSPWADSSIASIAFQDLVNHPWIDVLSLDDLYSTPTIEQYPNSQCYDLLCTPLRDAPETNNQNIPRLLHSWPVSLTRAVWTMTNNLLRPTIEPDRYHLQSNYWSQLMHLWNSSTLGIDTIPEPSCEQDIDIDEIPECIFASENTTATFEIADASLITAFHLDDTDATQWVGPTSQIVVGMSDPLFWDLDAGTHSDPSVIPGSFILDTAEPLTFEVSELNKDHILFTSTDSAIRKDYYFTEDSLSVTIETDQPLSTDLVLALDPQQRFQPGWANMYNIFSQTEDSFCWGAEDGKAVCISWTGDPDVEINTFKDSLKSLTQPLNPNKVYPSGHFLPMSLATVTFSTDKDFTVTLSQYTRP